MISYRAPLLVADQAAALGTTFNDLLGAKARYNYTVDVHHVSAARIRRLNRQYRHKDEPTDVLSFPLWSAIADLPEHDALLGDLVIAPSQTGGRHLDLLECYRHGTLHLLGYDHATNNHRWRHAYQTLVQTAA